MSKFGRNYNHALIFSTALAPERLNVKPSASSSKTRDIRAISPDFRAAISAAATASMAA